MFQEFFAKHPLQQLLRAEAPLFPPCGDPAWQQLVPRHVREIECMVQAYRQQPYPMRRATDFLSFVRDGSRKADENPYFFRRRKLSAAVLGYCLSPNAQDLDAVVDGLWCICEESSWVISAHNVNPLPGAVNAGLPDTDDPYVDLFAAQTGMILSIVCSLMAQPLDGVSPVLCRRVQQEIRRRILTPFMTTDEFWWMGFRRSDLNNWTPWIISNVMMSAILLPYEPLSALLERGCMMLDRWLDCLPEDGGCDEGAAYWNLAGGALLDCLQLLDYVTAHQAVFWQDEKLRRILAFPAKVQISDHWFVNFADCDARPFLSGQRLQWAGRQLEDSRLLALGAAMGDSLSDELADTPHLSRLLYKLFDPVQPAPAPAPEDVWLPDLQLRLVRRSGMVLCVKGGHNGESHNHNDVGSFMLYVEGQPQVVDAGNMVYTAKTFSDERYTLWNTRAAYHNLPLIGNHEQQPGRQFTARDVQCLPNGLSLDIAPAYAPEAAVTACCRSLCLEEAALSLTDCLSLSQSQPVTWVWMLRHQPTISQGSLIAGSIRLTYDDDLCLAAEELPITDARMAGSFPGSLWRIALTAHESTHHTRTFTVEKV